MITRAYQIYSTGISNPGCDWNLFIDLLAWKGKAIYEKMEVREEASTRARSSARSHIMNKWQQRWVNNEVGRWIKKLVLDLEA